MKTKMNLYNFTFSAKDVVFSKNMQSLTATNLADSKAHYLRYSASEHIAPANKLVLEDIAKCLIQYKYAVLTMNVLIRKLSLEDGICTIVTIKKASHTEHQISCPDLKSVIDMLEEILIVKEKK